ncbi:tripartite tricarboxylate transporter substrate-binding protein [Sediminicoccus sp. KRV36]|uniref:Bug family tripartite tricarboxylate transporter substrate binding protein n=1 Tax=Sediminicoccus sp. KRV36 TaxID=3133721 RepID=UPI00200D9DD5|nr:tripartite tricarboxylate transporter substrate-binding protein [Sediminicoccus rosea]UPY37779.1 tripartite tricarboxylate transporter substrate binding protein [Sediminicoccus rosea]
MQRRALLATATLAPFAAQAQPAWRPDRPIRVVVPYAPGGTTDVLARIMAEPVGQILGQPLVVENRPGGAAGLVGTDFVAKSTPDGTTIIVHSNGHAIAPALVARMPFDPVADFAGLSMLGRVPQVLCVNPRLPVTTLAELVALLRANPGRYHFASAGIGTAVHLGGEIFRAVTQVDIAAVHYRGGGPAMQGVITGEAIFTVDPIASALGHIRGGNVRALVVAGPERAPTLPDVPSASELGLPEFAVDAWIIAMAPARTPPQVVAAFNAAFATAQRQAAQRMAEQAVLPMPELQTPEQIMAFVRTDMARYAAVMRGAGIRPE